MTELTRLQDAFLASRKLADDYELSDLSSEQVRALPMDMYRRARVRAGLAAADPYIDVYRDDLPPGRERPQEPAQTTPPAADPGPPGVDPDSEAYFHAWRSQRQRGGEGVGLFDSVSSQSDEYTDAVRAQAGRTGWTTGNVQEAPRLGRAYVQQEQPPVYRSAADRFASPGGVFGN